MKQTNLHPVYAGPPSQARPTPLQAQRQQQIAAITEQVQKALERQLAPIKKQIEENGKEIQRLQTAWKEKMMRMVKDELSKSNHAAHRALEQYRLEGLARN